MCALPGLRALVVGPGLLAPAELGRVGGPPAPLPFDDTELHVKHFVEEDGFEEVAGHDAAIQIGVNPDEAAVPVVGAEVDRAAPPLRLGATAPGDEGSHLPCEIAFVEVVEHLLEVEVPPAVAKDDPPRSRRRTHPGEPCLAIEPYHPPPQVRLGAAQEPDKRPEDPVGSVEEGPVQREADLVGPRVLGLHDVPAVVVEGQGDLSSDVLLEVSLELIAAHGPCPSLTPREGHPDSTAPSPDPAMEARSFFF